MVYHIFLDAIKESSPALKRAYPFVVMTQDEAGSIYILDTSAYCIWRGLPKGTYSNDDDVSMGIVQGLRVCTTTKHEILVSAYTI